MLSEHPQQGALHHKDGRGSDYSSVKWLIVGAIWLLHWVANVSVIIGN